MKKAISFWSLPMDGTATAADGFAWAKKAGFDGVELLLVPDEGLWGIKSVTPRKDLMKMAEDNGLELASITLGPKWCQHLLTSKSPKSRQKALDNIKEMIDIAHEMKIRALLAVDGGFDFSWADPSWNACTEFLMYQEAYDAALEGFRSLAPIAEAANVIVAVENISGFLNSPLEYVEFVDKCESKFIQCFLDIGNIPSIGEPIDWIYACGDRIANMHVKDYLKSKRVHCDLLAGDINWPGVMKALEDVGYEHYLIAEMIPAYKYYPDQLIYNTYNSLTRIMDKK